MTDIVLFQLHFSHLPTDRLDSVCTCGLKCESVCLTVWRTWMWACMSWIWEVHMTTVLISSELSPLLGCRGSSREKKKNWGSHPISLWSRFRCISNYCSQTHIRNQTELHSQGTWMGGGDEKRRKCLGFLVKERTMDGKQGGGARLYRPTSSWRPTGS